MEFLRQKCAAPPQSEPEQNLAEVSLAQFAALGGLTEREYSQKLFENLERGNLACLLTLNAADDLCQWMNEVREADDAFGDEDYEFAIVFRLSLNRQRDVCLWIVFKTKKTGIFVRHAIPGFIDHEPPEIADIEVFEISFTDMEPRI